MDPQSCSNSIIISDLSADTEVVAPPAPNKPHEQTPTSSSACLAVERDDVFYFETITFQVEDTLFRVLKSGFEVEGSPFEAMFSLPQAPGEILEGTDDSSPIYLHGITKVSFRSFLRVLFPFKGAATTYPEWIAALDLATRWDFKKIRKTCIEALSELIKSRTSFDNILLAKQYKVKKWLRDGYVQLLRQTKALELGDDICTSEIDMITIVRLLYIRERKHGSLQGAKYCHYCSRGANDYGFSSAEAYKKIDEVFADEIAGMQDD